MNLLVAFATTDGMTETISERLAECGRASGHNVKMLDLRGTPAAFTLSEFDAIVIGASLHAGGYQRSVKRFIRAHLPTLNIAASAFFSVCLAQASKHEAERAEGLRIAEQFVAGLGWRPRIVQPIAGALRFSRYGWLRRIAMRRIARKEQPGIDVTRDHEYTDWDQVDAFLSGFLGLAIEDRLVEIPRPERRVPPSCQLVPDRMVDREAEGLVS
jgi:menaquinone-dependent protoporphyrinogen oxidase